MNGIGNHNPWFKSFGLHSDDTMKIAITKTQKNAKPFWLVDIAICFHAWVFEHFSSKNTCIWSHIINMLSETYQLTFEKWLLLDELEIQAFVLAEV